MKRGFRAGWAAVALAVFGLGLAAQPVLAIEFWDERVQVHGFFETRMSFGYEDFNSQNKIDMYGWLQVLNVEIESEIAPDGWGPFDMIAAFSRIEVKYDCVWNHACGTLPSVDAFGNQPKNLPHRVQTGQREGLAGSQATFDRRPFWFADRARLNGGEFADTKAGQRASKSFVYGSTNVGLFGASAGPDEQLGPFDDIRHENFSVPVTDEFGVTQVGNPIFYDGNFTNPFTQLPGDDDAGLYLFNRTSHCRVGNWEIKDSSLHRRGQRELIWGIDGCRVRSTGFTRFVANPFADDSSSFGGDVNPVLLAEDVQNILPGYQPLDPNGDGIPTGTALPLRPGPEHGIGSSGEKAPRGESQGIFMPNLQNRLALQGHDYDNPDQNFTKDELQWNHGASQQQLRELREAYLEFEAFESQLWVRAGKQTIVWGKTELFRNQDQFNPVDIALGPLASLEESRIALWALRGIWSFYEVGPLEDFRLELATIYDQFEPTDLGRCGEPFVPRLACTKSYGLWVHGENATGVAGEIRPEDPYDSWSGIEAGARVEFRYDRFSFALTDYYGYQDTPYVSILFQYDRNVDPGTGRPRHTESRGRCLTGAEEACLERFVAPGLPGGNTLDSVERSVVEVHSINQSLFAWICAGTVGVAPAVDSAACAFTLFNAPVGPLGPFATTISLILAGRASGVAQYNLINGDTVSGALIGPALDAAFGPSGTNTLAGPGTPLVPLVYNGVNDGGAATLTGLPMSERNSLANFLTNEQEALLGCGPFYLTDCNLNGADLANAAADVLLQSFPWFEGTKFNSSWNTTDASLPQPGTVDAAFNANGMGGTVDAPDTKFGELETGPAGTRYDDLDGDGKRELINLPGSRYDPLAFLLALGLPVSVDPTVNQATLATALAGVDPYVFDNLAQYDTTNPQVPCAQVGCVDGSAVGDPLVDNLAAFPGGGPRIHPFTGQIFSNEMAILSWNLLMLTVALGAADNPENRSTLDRNQPLALGRCSYAQPQFCSFVSGLASVARNTNSSVRAGGNGRFGRRNFVWSTVGDVQLRYEKRNIIGFSTDFAEDVTKSSWGVEFTYIDDTLAADGGDIDELGEVDEYNLTVSVDRPTFINFLNANRTFFINSQIFISYLQGYNQTMFREGPWTALLLVNANTGYFQDRFLVSAAGVYDFTTASAAFLPSVQYRFTENFSITLGGAVLAGGWTNKERAISQFSATSSTNLNDTVYVENGISPVRDLDNFFLRLRYTF